MTILPTERALISYVAIRSAGGWALAAGLALTPSVRARHIGNEVRANTALNVRASPAGPLAGTRVTGDLGVILEGPVNATLAGGSPLIWWRIDWASGTDGWSFEGGLDQQTLSHGIDVSHWQGVIDWPRVAGEGGAVFAIAKATEGTGFIDAQFSRNMSEGRAAGLSMGAYHFARPGATPTLDADALAEARHFIKTLHPWLDNGGLRPVLDLEDGLSLGKADLSSWARAFLGEVRRLTTSNAIVYTSRTYAQNFIDPDLAVHPLWIAVPNTEPGANTFDLGPWPRWSIQQHSWTGQVPGIGGDVDLNVFSGTEAQLQTLALPPLTHVLSDLAAVPSVAVRGSTVELAAAATSSRARSLLLGATLFPAGLATGGTSDPLRDQPVTLNQGLITTRRSFVLPTTLEPGDYDLVMALYLDLDASGTINSGDLPVGNGRRRASALRVEAASNFATWAAAAGLVGPTADPTADPDHDGWENLLEYAFGRSPTAAQVESPVTVTISPARDTPDQQVLRLQFLRWPARTDLNFAIQQSDHLNTGTWTTIATADGGTGFVGPGLSESESAPIRVTADVPLHGAAESFLRVQVRRIDSSPAPPQHSGLPR